MEQSKDELAKKKKIRAAHGGVATKLIGRVRQKLQDIDHQEDEIWLRQQAENAKEKITVLKNIDDEVMELMVTEDHYCTSDELETLIEEGDWVKLDL